MFRAELMLNWWNSKVVGHHQEDDDEYRLAHWTSGEKKRVMTAVQAFENRAVFLATCKRILFTCSAILVALATIRVSLGDYWTAFVVALQQGHH